MGYYAVKGGTEAIENAKKLAEFYRLRGETRPIEIDQLRTQFRFALDKIMGEGSLYAPEHAAIALKQVEGDVFEAAFIMRAFRATLERRYYSDIVNTRDMFVCRRISSTFKEIPGGQILGPTRDYSQRLLDSNLTKETIDSVRQFVVDYNHVVDPTALKEWETFSRVSDILKHEGILKAVNDEGVKTVVDITREAIAFPAPRSAALQSMARAETGSLMAFAYASMRGHGLNHGTIGELRVGRVAVRITDTAGRNRYIGRIMMTECEVFGPYTVKKKNSVPHFSVGYGLCFGHNETKAICMGQLDRVMRNPEEQLLTQEFVLYHTEGIEAMGFTNHWKLPHYVTFQASLNTMRDAVNRKEKKQDPGLSTQ